MHDDQLDGGTTVARALIADQFPEWSDRPITSIDAEGTQHTIHRLGHDLAIRLPLRPGRTRSDLEAEAAAADEVAGAISVRSPEVAAIGEPTERFPSPWSVQTWLDGTTATESDVTGSIAFGADLGRLVVELRAIPTRGRRFAGGARGGRLTDHDDWVEHCLRKSAELLDTQLVDTAPLRSMWAELRTLPSAGADRMSHGDLLPGNLLVDGDRLVGVLDVGGFGAADPALDLICAWNTLDPPARAAFRDVVDPSELEWLRGRAWALEQALGLVWYYVESNPVMAELGRRTLDRLLED